MEIGVERRLHSPLQSRHFERNGDLALIDASPPGQSVPSDPHVVPIRMLGECFRVHGPGLVRSKVEPDFDPIRSGPRFRRVLVGIRYSDQVFRGTNYVCRPRPPAPSTSSSSQFHGGRVGPERAQRRRHFRAAEMGERNPERASGRWRNTVSVGRHPH